MPGPSSSCVPWSKTPPGAGLPSPNRGVTALAFGSNNTLGTRNVIVFEATHPRPTRSRAYASPVASPRPSPGLLPARAGSPLAGRVSHPLDDERSFMESSHPPFPFDQPCLAATVRAIRPSQTPRMRLIADRTTGSPTHQKRIFSSRSSNSSTGNIVSVSGSTGSSAVAAIYRMFCKVNGTHLMVFTTA